jgi:hypothetical protein
MARSKHPPGPPMTLGNMRALGDQRNGSRSKIQPRRPRVERLKGHELRADKVIK